ncbi:MAG: PadR family transcriptional regulator [Actinomycetota bacterium]
MHTEYVIRGALLALLNDRAKYGYQLKSEFEASTGSAWALNIGQVYSTLKRMERDGVVLGLGQDEEGRPRYQLTAEGREELAGWLSAAVERSVSSRDEVTMKVLMAAATGAGDPTLCIAVQREVSMQTLQTATVARDTATSLADRLHLERLIVSCTAELRWLDIAEEALAGGRTPAPGEVGDTTTTTLRTEDLHG